MHDYMLMLNQLDANYCNNVQLAQSVQIALRGSVQFQYNANSA